MAWFTVLLWIALIAFIASVPLHLAIRMLGGRTNLFKTALINIVVWVVAGAIKSFISKWGGLIALIVVIIIYREAFRLKWWKAFVAWILQMIIAVVLIFILGILGIAAIALW